MLLKSLDFRELTEIRLIDVFGTICRRRGEARGGGVKADMDRGWDAYLRIVQGSLRPWSISWHPEWIRQAGDALSRRFGTSPSAMPCRILLTIILALALSGCGRAGCGFGGGGGSGRGGSGAGGCGIGTSF